MTRTLEQVHIAVCRNRNHWRSAHETALRPGAVLGTLRRALAPRPPSLQSLLRRRDQRWDSPIRRIHDQRGSLGAADRRNLCPQVIRPGTEKTHAFIAFHSLPLTLSRFLLGKHLFVCKPAGSLQGRKRAVVPDALQVRVPPRGTRRRQAVRGGCLGLARDGTGASNTTTITVASTPVEARSRREVICPSSSRKPGFPYHLSGISILPTGSGPLYTSTPLRTPDFFSARYSAPNSRQSGAALDGKPTGALAFRAFLRHRSLLMLFLRHADFVALTARQPAGTGSAQILRSMSPNSRRVRCPSASRSQ